MWPTISRTSLRSTASHDAPCRRSSVRERLLQKNCLARFGGCNRSLLMQPIRQADADRLKSGQSKERAIVGEAGRAGYPCRLVFRSAIAVAHSDQFGGRMFGIDPRMAQAEEAEPDHTDLEGLDHLRGSGIRQLRKSSMKADRALTAASKKAEPASGLARRGSPSVPLGERSAKS